MMTEILVAAAGSIAFVIGRLSVRRTSAAVEPRCTGYRAYVLDEKTGRSSKTYFMHDDCKSLRSPTCMDGRCTLHCRDMCRCDAPNDPEFIGRRRV